MAKKNTNGAMTKADLYRLRDGLQVVLNAGYGCFDLGIQAARNLRRVTEEIEDLEKAREPQSEKFKEYAKEQDALFKLHGTASLGPGGFEQHTVPEEKQPDLIRDLNKLREKFAKAITEQEEKNKKFDEKAKATKAEVKLRKVSEGLIKREVPKLSTSHALGILEMIDE